MDKKDTILNTTLELLTEQGFYATPMSQIAKEANIAAGTIYTYFKSKEELILSLHLSIKREMVQALLAGMDEEAGTEETFFQLWLNLFRFFIQNPLKFKFLEQFENSPYLAKQDEEAIEQMFETVKSFLSHGIQQNKFIDIPVDLMLSMVYGNIVAVVKLQLSEKVSLDKSIIQKAMEMSWNSIKK